MITYVKNIQLFPVVIAPDTRGGRGDRLPRLPPAQRPERGGGVQAPHTRTQFICSSPYVEQKSAHMIIVIIIIIIPILVSCTGVMAK